VVSSFSSLAAGSDLLILGSAILRGIGVDGRVAVTIQLELKPIGSESHEPIVVRMTSGVTTLSLTLPQKPTLHN
jgi:hypothetical protein